MKVTMKDIAKKLNVSINAVSIALNDKPGVSDEMRLLILKTADEMGYINEKRKYLSVFSKSNIAIMMQSYYADTGHFYSIVLRSIVEEAKSLGYFSIMNYFDDSNMELPECIVDRKVAGIVIVGKISDMNLNQLISLQHFLLLYNMYINTPILHRFGLLLQYLLLPSYLSKYLQCRLHLHSIVFLQILQILQTL